MSSAEFQVERSTTIDAPAAEIYPRIIDFHRWTEWSPWEKLDPKLHRDYSGAASGVGSIYAWKGNRKAGEGRMEILEATDPSNVILELQFVKPMKSTNTTTFELSESGGTTTVRWVMTGPKGFMLRWFGKLINMDKLVGKDFEQGLAAIKEQSEAGA